MDYDRLIAKHKDAVYRQMVRVCGDRDDAEDVLADALVAAYKAKDHIRDDGAFKAWLATAARRSCYRLRKRESFFPRLQILDIDLASSDPSPQDALEMEEFKGCVRSALATLPPEFREVYELREVEGLSGQEVANRLSISVAAMKSRLSRARTQVRSFLDASLCPPVGPVNPRLEKMPPSL